MLQSANALSGIENLLVNATDVLPQEDLALGELQSLHLHIVALHVQGHGALHVLEECCALKRTGTQRHLALLPLLRQQSLLVRDPLPLQNASLTLTRQNINIACTDHACIVRDLLPSLRRSLRLRRVSHC